VLEKRASDEDSIIKQAEDELKQENYEDALKKL
jgi:hypothetical protein